MTVKFANPSSGENTENEARRGPKKPGFLSGRRARRAAAALLLPAIAATALLSSGGTAHAMTTPLSTYPTSECYANGTVTADRPTVNSDGQYVVFTPVLYVWSNGKWTYDGMGPIQAGYEPYEGSFGTWLAVSSINFSAQPHHYYEVVDTISTGAGTIKYTTQPMVGHVGSNYYCYTG
jgi:hypothetical protein